MILSKIWQNVCRIYTFVDPPWPPLKILIIYWSMINHWALNSKWNIDYFVIVEGFQFTTLQRKLNKDLWELWKEKWYFPNSRSKRTIIKIKLQDSAEYGKTEPNKVEQNLQMWAGFVWGRGAIQKTWGGRLGFNHYFIVITSFCVSMGGRDGAKNSLLWILH